VHKVFSLSDRFEKGGATFDWSVFLMKTSNHLINLAGRKNNTFYETDIFESVKVRDVRNLTIPDGDVLYREMLEILPVAVFIHSNGRFVYANQEAARLHGLTDASQLVDRILAEFIHPEDVHKFQKTFLENPENINEKHYVELRIVQAENVVRDLEVTSLPVLFAGKKARLAICVDRTEQKQIKNFLLNHLVFLETLIDTIPNPIFYKTRDGHYLGCNKMFAKKILGLPRQKIIGRTVYDFPEQVSLKDADIFHQYDQILFEQPGVQVFESKLVCADGIKRDFIFYKAPFRDADNIIAGLVGIMVDITELRKVEQDLYRYQDKLRGLSSSMALADELERHKIATNLHEQIGQALAVSKMKLGALQEVAFTREMLLALNEIRELVGQSLQDTRSLTFELSPPVLYEMGLKAALEWLVENVADRGTISYSYEDDGKVPELDGEVSVLLFRATRELLLNVAFHSDATDAVVNFSQDDQNVYIQVEDNGVGFDLAKIDEKNVELSAGMGLFSIRERINHLGGRLEVESKPGEGTRVTIVSPKKYYRK
jgi:PAS domain S-box-containing protein